MERECGAQGHDKCCIRFRRILTSMCWRGKEQNYKQSHIVMTTNTHTWIQIERDLRISNLLKVKIVERCHDVIQQWHIAIANPYNLLPRKQETMQQIHSAVVGAFGTVVNQWKPRPLCPCCRKLNSLLSLVLSLTKAAWDLQIRAGEVQLPYWHNVRQLQSPL